MPGSVKTSRTQVWFDSLGEWSWPGRAAEAVEALPPAWVPAFPRLEAAAVGASSPAPLAPARGARRSARLRPLALLLVAGALAALCTMLVIAGPQSLEPGVERHASPSAAATAPS